MGIDRKNYEPPIEREDHQAKNDRTIEYLNSLMRDTSGRQERDWPILKKALEINRMGSRPLFRD